MKKSIGCLLAVVAVVAVVGILAVGQYNGLVGAEQHVEEAWAQVENVYERRAALIPNLVATVKGSAAFEQETLTAVVEARSRVGQLSTQASEQILNDPARFAEFQKAQDGLSSALSRLLVVVERYPELQSTAAFRELMTQLEGTENRIAVARGRFNEVAQDYNTAIRVFPASLIASMSGFGPKAMFQADEGASRAPKVEF